jgi:GR25 family glycosyltransferase involved in LPS biosynthesis
MKIFVIHYKKLVNRKEHILNVFTQYNIIDYEFIEIDRDEIFRENITMFKEGYSKSQIAITLSHFYAYKQINEKYENGLIFEDDVILSDNFIEIFNKYVSLLPEDYDMLFIGNGCNLHINSNEIIPNKFIYKKSLNSCSVTRCTDSYVVNKKCASKLCEYINTLQYSINIPVDFWLNVAAKDTGLNVYWAEPTIVTQGTQNGLFKTSHDTYDTNENDYIHPICVTNLTNSNKNPLHNRMGTIMNKI